MRLGIVFCILFGFQSAWATMTLNGTPTGASALNLTDPTKPIIYGSFDSSDAMTAAGVGTSTIDTCTGVAEVASPNSKIFPCSKTAAYPGLKLHLEAVFTSDQVIGNAFVKFSTGSGNYSPSVNELILNGKILIFEIPWSTVCTYIGGSGTGPVGCTTSGTVDITMGFSGGTTSESFTFKVFVRSVDNSVGTGNEREYVDCPAASAGSPGFCHYEVEAGDQKVYLKENLGVSDSYPATPASGISYNGLIFFFEKQIPADGGNPVTTLGRVTNKSDFRTIGINTASKPPLADDRIDNLDNDATYCFVMANVDESSAITLFPPAATILTVPGEAAKLCGKPEEVLGLLNDKKCFIATAAFGSEMASEVNTFREFRNKYLIPFSWGRKFMHTYYKFSPPLAHWIAQHDDVRMIVRGFLWPLLVLVKFWLYSPLLAAALMGFSFLTALYFALRKQRGVGV